MQNIVERPQEMIGSNTTKEGTLYDIIISTTLFRLKTFIVLFFALLFFNR